MIKALKIFFFFKLSEEGIAGGILILFLMNILDCGKFSADLDIQLQVT